MIRFYRKTRWLVGFILLIGGCQEGTLEEGMTVAPGPSDPWSFADSSGAVVRHLDLRLEIDQEAREIKGRASWEFQKRKSNRIIFDTKDLLVERVSFGMEGEERNVRYALSAPYDELGMALVVEIREASGPLNIYYRTMPESDALVWLEENQTSGKLAPMLISKTGPILARSWIPCQDSPGSLITFSALVKVSPGQMVLMSGSNGEQRDVGGAYSFQSGIPVPVTSLGIAVGDFVSDRISPKMGLYGEPDLVDDAFYEFNHLEKYYDELVNKYGPGYGREHALMILSPYFPEGGQNWAGLSCVPSSDVTLDRNRVVFVLEQVCRNWTGVRTSITNWEDYWLMAGLATYMARGVIDEPGREFRSNTLYANGKLHLLNDLSKQDFSRELTALHTPFKGVNPGNVPFGFLEEKGSLFFKYLEKEIGAGRMESLLKEWFRINASKAKRTRDFIDFLQRQIELLSADELDKWMKGNGLPESVPDLPSPSLARAIEVGRSVSPWESALGYPTDDWRTAEWLAFIRNLPHDLDFTTMKRLDLTFDLRDSRDMSIRSAWFELAVLNGFAQEIEGEISDFLASTGRRAFVLPVYRAFLTRSMEEKAREMFRDAERFYTDDLRKEVKNLLNQ